MSPISKATNAGVRTATGIEFQKHCALFILVENYGNLSGKKYFICIEHHDDVMFCHQGAKDELTSVESFQAKKSSDKWGMSDTFFDILTKNSQHWHRSGRIYDRKICNIYTFIGIYYQPCNKSELEIPKTSS